MVNHVENNVDNKTAMNITHLRQAYRDKTQHPQKVIEQCLQQIHNSTESNAWITVLSPEQIAPYLDGLANKKLDDHPLWGIPFAIKDNIDLQGVPTTAGCPDYAYTPTQHAFVVEQFINAGAIPLGKTNLDQFATGLVGTRSPYGAVSNAFNADYISGGSSSGSAYAVATGQVSFSLGTDTAGSGRVPAAFNNIIGTKPSRGLLSCRGVVPACASLDCVTFFSHTQTDADTLLTVAAVYDESDTYSRKPVFSQKSLSQKSHNNKLRIGVPKEEQLAFFGHPEYLLLFQQACQQLEQAGAELVTIDSTPFLNAAKLLYQGPWVAERYHAVGAFIDAHTDKANATVAAIIQGGKNPSAVDAFEGFYQLTQCKTQADKILATVDAIVMPTTSNHYTIEEMNHNPIELNSNLGYYTNFMNLLDYSALAVPAGFTTQGLPFGITLFADAFEDKQLQHMSQRYLNIKNWGMGASQLPMPDVDLMANEISGSDAREEAESYIHIAVCGAHLSGMPLNSQLTDRESVLVESTTTSPHYAFYALAGGPPFRPALQRLPENTLGEAIFVEVWAVPEVQLGSFVAGIPAPLGIGKLELASGEWVTGFICEPYGLDDAKNITAYKDWREYIKSL